MITTTVPRSSAAYAMGAASARLATALLLCFAGAAAHAQSCTPTTPRPDPGTGFTPFGTNEQALARGGNSGPAWEWAVGTDTDSGQKVQGRVVIWVTNRRPTRKCSNTSERGIKRDHGNAFRIRCACGLRTSSGFEWRRCGGGTIWWRATGIEFDCFYELRRVRIRKYS
jgi:hypothetical protein